MTGGRLKRISRYLDSEEDFCFTYGDGIGDINISKAINEHKKWKVSYRHGDSTPRKIWFTFDR